MAFFFKLTIPIYGDLYSISVMLPLLYYVTQQYPYKGLLHLTSSFRKGVYSWQLIPEYEYAITLLSSVIRTHIRVTCIKSWRSLVSHSRV
jgi:hypothetical protein